MPETDSEANPETSDDEIIGRAFRWSLVAVVGIALVVTIILTQLGGKPPEPERRRELPSVVESAAAKRKALDHLPIPKVPLVDVTASSGVDFVHTTGAEGDELFPEFMGAACVMFDYDKDGDLDLFFTNGLNWPWSKKKDIRTSPALYRNDGKWRFTNVTKEAGLEDQYYGMGACAGDYDNDGDPDLFVCVVGSNRLYRNDGGRFVEVAQQAGVAGDPNEFSTACGWFDYDHDGDLDLLVGNYIVWSREINMSSVFRTQSGVRGNLNPVKFEGTLFYLYRNDGGGFFSDVSETSGIHVRNPNTGKPLGKALGIVFTDLDGDHWVDALVANDTARNFAYLNQRNGKFREMGEKVGIAFGTSGTARSGMGIDIADFRNDGTFGVAIGNFAGESTAFFVTKKNSRQQISQNELSYTDEAGPCGIAEETFIHLTFGVVFWDYDLDGRMDLLLANGHVDATIDAVEGGQTYAQEPMLFWNCHGLEAVNVDFVTTKPEHMGPDLFRPLVGRGLAIGDLDGDHDVDVVLTSNGGPVRLLRNDQQLGHHWLRLQLVGKKTSRDAVGTLVEVTADGRTMRQHLSPTRSYFAQCEPVLTFGLGKCTKVDRIRVVWPGGQEQLVETDGVDRVLTIEQHVEQATGVESSAAKAAP